jgi:hypothetical protein
MWCTSLWFQSSQSSCEHPPKGTRAFLLALDAWERACHNSARPSHQFRSTESPPPCAAARWWATQQVYSKATRKVHAAADCVRISPAAPCVALPWKPPPRPEWAPPCEFLSDATVDKEACQKHALFRLCWLRCHKLPGLLGGFRGQAGIGGIARWECPARAQAACTSHHKSRYSYLT